MEFERQKRATIHLNIAPLIDVVLLLLIFFMLSSHFMMLPGLKIELPHASTAKIEPQEEIIISITKAGAIYLNQIPVTLETLPSLLGKKIHTVQKRDITVRADEEISLGLGVRVMDIARQVGVNSLTIAAKKTKEE